MRRFQRIDTSEWTRIQVGCRSRDYVEKFPADKTKRPWFAVVDGKVLRKSDGFGRRFSTRRAAIECVQDRLAEIPFTQEWVRRRCVSSILLNAHLTAIDIIRSAALIRMATEAVQAHSLHDLDRGTPP